MPKATEKPTTHLVIDLTDPSEGQAVGAAPARAADNGPARTINTAVLLTGLLVALVAGVVAFMLLRPVSTGAGATLDAATVIKDDRGSELTADVATTVLIPAGLTGQHVDQASAALEALGLSVEQMAEVVSQSAGFHDGDVMSMSPAPGATVQADTIVAVTYAVVDVPTSEQPAPAPFRPSIGWAGSPAGSGCTPGPGSLPDGTWFGFVRATSGAEFSFDLICYDGNTDSYTNQNPLLRSVPMAVDMRVECADGPCSVSALDTSLITGLGVEGGYATVVFNGVGG